MLKLCNYSCEMAQKIDPDDLIDAAGVAEILGLSSRTAVGVYRGRYPDFPAPAVERGQCRLWLKPDIAAWSASRRG
jgi:hypothetical protein